MSTVVAVTDATHRKSRLRLSRFEGLLRYGRTPVDGASLAFFRIAFGLILAFAPARFLANDWVTRFFVEPRFYFKYWGFAWIEVLSPNLMHAAFVLLVFLGLCVTLGLFYRLAAFVYLLVFTYVELIDVTNYLNHYYLVSLLCFWLAILPLNKVGSIETYFASQTRDTSLPRWALLALRFQVGIVYLNAGLAKFGPDWLIQGEPLSIWLAARTETPVIGRFFDEPGMALAMSWGGFLFDTTIPFWLSIRRTRLWAFGAVVVFHSLTGALFNIGLFPWIMVASASVFLGERWPRQMGHWLQASRLGRAWRAGKGRDHFRFESTAATSRAYRARPAFWDSLARSMLALFALAQILIPLRSHLYGGNVLWHEQGMRWSWRVMVREKNGSVMYRVLYDGSTRERLIAPSRYLTAHQEREMSGQPDLILQLAHQIRDDLQDRGHRNVQVRVHALVSLNGRPARPMVDPQIDLSKVSDGLMPATYVTPFASSAPFASSSLRSAIVRTHAI
ncbi:MAG: HTTM domain-containing protein [Myxococcota bacterium]